MPWSTAARSPSTGWTSRPATRRASTASTTSTSCPASRSWRRSLRAGEEGAGPPRPSARRAEGFAYWPADYWVTLGTSGLLTALTGALLVGLARDLGCSPRRGGAGGPGVRSGDSRLCLRDAGLRPPGLGLRPARLVRADSGTEAARSTPHCRHASSAGFLAASASVIELQVGPVSAILGLLPARPGRSAATPDPGAGRFAVGAVVPTLVLLGYNQLAFGSPWDMGYFHHVTAIFATSTRRENPLGLAGAGLGAARAAPLGPLSRSPLLCPDPPALRLRAGGASSAAPVLGPGDRLDRWWSPRSSS